MGTPESGAREDGGSNASSEPLLATSAGASISSVQRWQEQANSGAAPLGGTESEPPRDGATPPIAVRGAVAAKAEQPLQTPWTFWFDRVLPGSPYETTLQRLGTVQTVQGFWRYYCNLKRPGQLKAGENYHLFRGALQPAQETLPGGGCWLLRVRRSHQRFPAEVSRLWEKLLLSVVGETVGEACVVGAGVSVRSTAAVLAIWCRDEGDALSIKRVGQRLQCILEPTGADPIQWRAAPPQVRAAPPAASQSAKPSEGN